MMNRQGWQLPGPKRRVRKNVTQIMRLDRLVPTKPVDPSVPAAPAVAVDPVKPVASAQRYPDLNHALCFHALDDVPVSPPHVPPRPASLPAPTGTPRAPLPLVGTISSPAVAAAGPVATRGPGTRVDLAARCAQPVRSPASQAASDRQSGLRRAGPAARGGGPDLAGSPWCLALARLAPLGDRRGIRHRGGRGALHRGGRRSLHGAGCLSPRVPAPGTARTRAAATAAVVAAAARAGGFWRRGCPRRLRAGRQRARRR